MDARPLLMATASRAADYLDGLPDRPVAASATVDELQAALGGPLPTGPTPADEVIAELVAAAEPGLVADAGPRYFGFVIGGALPVSVAADWLTSTWDQNAGLYAGGPAAAVAEDVAGRWLRDLLGLPADGSVGFVTGAHMANVTALVAARHHVLAAAGWDVEADGLAGAPRLRIVVGEQRHASIDRACRFVGLGTKNIVAVPADEHGRMRVDALPNA